MIHNQAIKDFFESLQNTERDFLTIESFEHYMKKAPRTLLGTGIDR
jgi:hypothetical protein